MPPSPPSASEGPGGGDLRVSVFDLDRTLTQHGTYLRFLLFAGRRLAPWRLIRLLDVLLTMAAYKAGLLRRDRLKEIMHRRLLGPSVAGSRLRPIVEAYADRIVRNGCRPHVVDRLKREMALGRTIVIATAAQRVYAEALAARWNVRHVVATDNVWIDDALQARLDGPNRRGAAKLEALNAWLKAHPVLSASGYVVYSDDLSDLPLFENAVSRVVVHPGSRLRRIAQERGWEIIG